MNRDAWQDDPEIQRALHARSVRNGVIRTVVVWTPLFLVAFGALVYFFLDVVTGGENGTVFLLVVLAIFSLLFGFQSIQALLDLFGEPHRETATVTRRWARSDSFVMRTHYVRLEGGQILRGDRLTLDQVEAGDRVDVRYYPHSGVLIELEKVKNPEKPREPGA